MTATDPAASTATESTISADSRPRLPLSTRATYGLGDFAGGFVWSTTVSYLAIFYTDAVGIGVGVVGVLMLGARVFDALIDPVIGSLAERTRSRHGRFRPWILYGMLPLAGFAVLTFTAPFPGDSAAAVVYAVITYGILGILYSAVNLPYGALASVMAETPADRISLGTFRFLGIMLNGVLIALVTVPLVRLFSGAEGGQTATVGGYTITMAVFAVISLPMLFAVFKTSRETITPVRREPVSLRATLGALAGNRYLTVFLVFTVLAVVANFGRLGVLIYYYEYNVGNTALIPVLLGLTQVCGIVGTLVFTRFAQYVGKRNLLMIGLGVQAVALIALYFAGANNIAVVIALTAIHGLAGFSLVMTLSMVSDVVDYGEHKTGIRADGTTYAIFSFSMKFASGISATALGLIGAFGYTPNATQTTEALNGINFVVNLLPALVGIAAMLVLLAYRLTDQEAAAIRNELNAAAKAAPAGQ
ncbi:MFS transporter [Streptomyces sp. OE57]|uniref:MFS transporter n=1 Tax=Streptomyces lacaronensis TaxID=3379885 RepID=UPI0039B771C6